MLSQCAHENQGFLQLDTNFVIDDVAQSFSACIKEE